MTVIKITGATLFANSTFGNSTVGNTCANTTSLYVYNNGGGLVALTLAKGTANTAAVPGANVGPITIGNNASIVLRKYPFDQVFSNNSANTIQLTPIAAGS